MITTYKQRERREGIKLVTVPCPAPPESMAQLVELFRKGITPKTRVMLCSHVTFVTGQVFPVREICRLGRERGIPVIVDGAHSFAQLAFRRDDLECEYFGNSLHKWLTGPHGTGFLYVRRDRIKPLWPLMAAPDKLDDDIRKFEEIGTHPAANKLAIAEAITFHEAIGPERREMRLRFLRDRWAKRLAADKRVKFFTRLEPEHSCAVATLAIDGVDHAKLAEHLWNKHRVYAGVQGIRISSNVYTTLEEIDLFSRAMEEVLANGLPA
jgi:selenocysteine lyase/cysteine desulfurase